MNSPAQLTIWRCRNHPTSWAIALDHAEHGTSLTPFICCGRWDLVTAIAMSPRQLREAIETCENEIERLAQEAEDA